jgi:hypothetical protein
MPTLMPVSLVKAAPTAWHHDICTLQMMLTCPSAHADIAPSASAHPATPNKNRFMSLLLASAAFYVLPATTRYFKADEAFAPASHRGHGIICSIHRPHDRSSKSARPKT